MILMTKDFFIKKEMGHYNPGSTLDERLLDLGADPAIARKFYDVFVTDDQIYAVSRRISGRIGETTPEKIEKMAEEQPELISRIQTLKGVVIFDVIDNSPLFGKFAEKNLCGTTDGLYRDDPYEKYPQPNLGNEVISADGFFKRNK